MDISEQRFKEFRTEIHLPNFALSKRLASLTEVQQLVNYVHSLHPYAEDYTPKKWCEIYARPNSLIGFGGLGDWYRFMLQNRDKMLLAEEMAQRNTTLSNSVSILQAEITSGSIKPQDIDWGEIVESFDFDPPKFNEYEASLHLKINIATDAIVIILINAHHWERYYEDESRKVGDSGEIKISVIESNVKQLQQFTGTVVLHHDITDCDYNFKTPDEPIRLNLAFFTEISSLLKVDKQNVVKFLLDTCHYPFERCDWKETMPETKLTSKILPGNLNYGHIEDEILIKVPNAMKIFERGYLKRKDHIAVLDYLSLILLDKVRDEHCKYMALISLKEDRYFDYSKATDLISKTHWHKVSENDCSYSIDVFNGSEYQFCLDVNFKLIEEYQQYFRKMMKLVITKVNKKVEKNIRALFKPICLYHSDHECNIKHTKNNKKKGTVFSIALEIHHLCNLTAVEVQALEVIIKLMHLDWSVPQFWKFLFEMMHCEEDESACEGEFVPELFVDRMEEDRENRYSYAITTIDSDTDDLPDYEILTGEGDMDLDEELNDIYTDAEPIEATRKSLITLYKSVANDIHNNAVNPNLVLPQVCRVTRTQTELFKIRLRAKMRKDIVQDCEHGKKSNRRSPTWN